MSQLFSTKFAMTTCLIIACLFFLNCNQKNTSDYSVANKKSIKAKYIFLFIGDGMGPVQEQVANDLLNFRAGHPRGWKSLHFRNFPLHTQVRTWSESNLVTGSASAATALSNGHKTNNGILSLKKDKKTHLPGIAELAQKAGRKIGILSSVSLDHATPAAFYAQSESRNSYYDIAVQIPKNKFDFFAGGSFRNANDQETAQKPALSQIFKDAGYRWVKTSSDLKKLSPKDLPAIASSEAADGGGAMPFDMDLGKTPRLADYTQKAIELLYNPNGFFILVEGGRIDWAGHNNDLGANANEVIAFDRAVGKAVQFYREHPDETLILVTADHETGGLSMGSNENPYVLNYEFLNKQKVSQDHLIGLFNEYRDLTNESDRQLSDLDIILKNKLGIGLDSNSMVLTHADSIEIQLAFNASMKPSSIKLDSKNKGTYGNRDPLAITLTKLITKKAGFSWGTFNHSGANVSLWVKGKSIQSLATEIDNTEIPKLIANAAGF